MDRLIARGSLVALGFAAAVGQAALLREAMAALGGSELAWGAVLALWLIGTGVGSWLGAGRPGVGAVSLLPAVAVVLALAGVVTLRAAPALAGSITGESASTLELLWLWCLAILPASVAGGYAFAALSGRLSGAGAAGAAYALEAFGACVGGVIFTFALASSGSAAALAAALGLVVAIRLATGRRWLSAGLAAAVGVASIGPVARHAETLAWRWSDRVGALREWRETREQRLEVAGSETLALYADGRLVATYPDPWRVAPRAHLLMLLHPGPRRVLALGSLADGSLPVMLLHPVEELTVVEEDPALVELVRDHSTAELSAALSDPRTRVVTGDPLRALDRAGGRFDLILLLDGDPSTLRRNRTRTSEFLRACAARLSPGGRVVVRVGVSDTYLGGVGGRLLATLAATLRAAVGHVSALPGEEVVLVAAAREADVAEGMADLVARWRRRDLDAATFDEEMIELLVDPGRRPQVSRFLVTAGGAANSAGQPRAVILAAALSEGRGSPRLVSWVLHLTETPRSVFWVVIGLVGALVLLSGITGRGLGAAGGATLGFASMTWWLLLMAVWQSRFGSVYAEVGALSGLFMGGLAAGALLARRRGLESPRSLAALLVLGAAVSLMLASGAPLVHPQALVVPLLLAAGVLTGAGFPAVAHLSGAGSDGRGAGRAFAADEVGAGLAALGMGLVGMAWVGMFQVASGLALLQAAAAAALALAARRVA